VTTSPETADLNHAALRRFIDGANALPLDDRITLLKGLIPGTAKELTPPEFDSLIAELLLKGERLYEALGHPGEGRATRLVMGERDLEGR
jgi:hypothetical protein